MGTFSVYFDLGNASPVEGALGRAFDRILPAFAFHLLRLWHRHQKGRAHKAPRTVYGPRYCRQQYA